MQDIFAQFSFPISVLTPKYFVLSLFGASQGQLASGLMVCHDGLLDFSFRGVSDLLSGGEALSCSVSSKSSAGSCRGRTRSCCIWLLRCSNSRNID